MMSLKHLLARSADADPLREMSGFAAKRLMEIEVGAGYGEKPSPLSAMVPSSACRGLPDIAA